MRIILPTFETVYLPERDEALGIIERAGRTCYKSEEGDASKFVMSIVKRGHLSVIEHVNATIKFLIDRGVSHELVRHRLAAYSQESTRYCNYSSGKFGSEITVVLPNWIPPLLMDQIHNNFIDEAIDDFGLVLASKAQVWYNGCMKAERAYMNLIALKCSPQEARSVLPNSLKTEVVMTANLREWKHVVELRSSKAAHPQIREVMIPLKEMFIGWLPEVFYEPHC